MSHVHIVPVNIEKVVNAGHGVRQFAVSLRLTWHISRSLTVFFLRPTSEENISFTGAETRCLDESGG